MTDANAILNPAGKDLVKITAARHIDPGEEITGITISY
jgi:hypothetical protein